MERAERGQSRKVPGLKYAFVYQDNWTRLNVRPAKIMQVTNLFNPKCFTLENNFIVSKSAADIFGSTNHVSFFSSRCFIMI